MVGFVSDELPQVVTGERHSEVDKIHKTARGKCRFNQSHVSVTGTVVKVTCGKQFRGIGFRTVDTEFVISLFVASGIDGSSPFESF